VRTGTHGFPIALVQPAAADEDADYALADRRLKLLHGLGREGDLLKRQDVSESARKNAP